MSTSAVNATRFCFENGTWARLADYQNCRPIRSSDYIYTDVHIINEEKHLEVATYVYVGGYCTSLVAVTSAIIVLNFFRDLRCLRNTIHTNLLVTYELMNLAWLVRAGMIYNSFEPQILCIFGIILTYLLVPNFFWMFIEGLHLYIMVIRPFQVELMNYKVYFIIGWVSPAILILLWIIIKWKIDIKQLKDSLDHKCLWIDQHAVDYIYQAPILFLLLVNLFFLSRILWTLVRKIRAASTSRLEFKQYRKAAKALVVLTPLFGVTYLVVIVQPADEYAKRIFQIVQALLLSTQGLVVAILYCFMNAEVQSVLRTHFQRWRLDRRDSRLSISRFSHVKKTRSSHEIVTREASIHNGYVTRL